MFWYNISWQLLVLSPESQSGSRRGARWGSCTVVMIVENGTTTSIAVLSIKGENEPTIPCDNPGRLIEWFHMKCKKMKNAPRKYFLF